MRRRGDSFTGKNGQEIGPVKFAVRGHLAARQHGESGQNVEHAGNCVGGGGCRDLAGRQAMVGTRMPPFPHATFVAAQGMVHRAGMDNARLG